MDSVQCDVMELGAKEPGHDIIGKYFAFELSLIELVNRVADDEEIRQLHFNFLTSLTRENIQYVTNNTLNQSKSTLWYQVRWLRYTASIIGSALKRSKYNSTSQILANHINPTDEYRAMMDNNPYIRYGKETEGLAFAAFEKKNPHIFLSESGIIILEKFPWIAVSPDGIGYCSKRREYFTLEIKCPSTTRNAVRDGPGECLLVKMGLLNYDDPAYENHKRRYLQPIDSEWLYMHSGDKLVDKTHEYYIQCQLQMYAVDVKYGYFVVWCKDSPKPRIYTVMFERDDDLLDKIISAVTVKFHTVFVPAMIHQMRNMYDKYLFRCDIDHEKQEVKRIPLVDQSHYNERGRKKNKKDVFLHGPSMSKEDGAAAAATVANENISTVDWIERSIESMEQWV